MTLLDQPASHRIDRLTHSSTLREKVFENLLLGQLGIELIERDVDFAVLHAASDRDGYDIVFESGPITRHVQLKVTIAGGRTSSVTINTRLAKKPSGCVIWLVYDPLLRAFSQIRWFGGAPGQPLPDLGNRMAKQVRANAQGIKAIKPNMRRLTATQFEKLPSIASLADRLLGEHAWSVLSQYCLPHHSVAPASPPNHAQPGPPTS